MKLIRRDRLGMPGQVGMVLWVLCLYLYLGQLLPAEDRLAQLEAERARLAESAPGGAAAIAGTPPVSSLPSIMKRLNGLAEGSGLVVDRVVYQFKDNADTRRLVVNVPLVGSYPTIRAFLREALQLTPTATLDELKLQRNQASDAGITAQVGLSYLFASGA